jgi:hypothetical protein
MFEFMVGVGVVVLLAIVALAVYAPEVLAAVWIAIQAAI